MTTQTSKNDEYWGTSETKELLKKDILTGKVTDSMSIKQVWESRSEYNVIKYELFRSRLYALKKQLKTSKQRAMDDEKDYLHDRNLIPKPTENAIGLPVWNGSVAEKLLKEDLDNGLYIPGKVQQLHKSRKEYVDFFSLTVFRGRIHQEIQKRKFKAQYASQHH